MAAALCYGSRGGGASLAFHHQVDAYNTNSLIGALDQLRRTLGGEKATLLWDGLPAHRSKTMQAWLGRQRRWLVVEPLPGYAPELNPVEALWSNLKGVELANLAADTVQEATAAAQHGIQRIRQTHHLAYSFLRHCGLSLWEQSSRRRNGRTSLVRAIEANQPGAGAGHQEGLAARVAGCPRQVSPARPQPRPNSPWPARGLLATAARRPPRLAARLDPVSAQRPPATPPPSSAGGGHGRPGTARPGRLGGRGGYRRPGGGSAGGGGQRRPGRPHCPRARGRDRAPENLDLRSAWGSAAGGPSCAGPARAASGSPSIPMAAGERCRESTRPPSFRGIPPHRARATIGAKAPRIPRKSAESAGRRPHRLGP